MFCHALRVSELVTLRWEQVDLQNGDKQRIVGFFGFF
jgi:integrase